MTQLAEPDLDGIVIGEAVTLDIPIAGFPFRVAAFLIDALAQVLLLTIILVVTSNIVATVDDALIGSFAIILLVGIFIVVPIVIESITQGKSLGKFAFGIRVVRDDNGAITPRHAMVRGLIGFVEIWSLLGSAAGICALLTRREKRLGDIAAGTVVVRDRVPLQTPNPPLVPPHLVAWASRADIATLPTGLAMAIRQFITRRDQLSSQARPMVCADLTRRVIPLVAPAPPAGVHPEDVLMAVLAERSRRDSARLERERSLRQRLLHWK